MPRYIPEPVPSGDNLSELQRYIDAELNRISAAINVKVDGAYGGIFQVPGIKVISPLTAAFQLFDVFDITIPQKLDGVLGAPLLGSLQILTPGSFQFQFETTVVNIPPNAEYEFRLALNGVATELGGVINPSNQTQTVSLGFTLLFIAEKGDIFTIVVNSTTNTDLSVSGSDFSCNRVSEEF